MSNDRRRRNRIALLVPSSCTTMENDLHWALSKDQFIINTDRMYLVETTREAETAMLEKYAKPAAKDLGTTNPDLLIFGCSSAGALFGLDYDAAFCKSLGDLAGCPALGVINAADQALAAADARRIALITPYNEDLTAAVANALSANGREVVAAHGMGITVNVELADPLPSDIVEFAKSKLSRVSFDTLFVSCTNFRALEAKAELEKVFGAKVITSNSAVIDAVHKIFSFDQAANAT
jgi:maleate isomerase